MKHPQRTEADPRGDEAADYPVPQAAGSPKNDSPSLVEPIE
jgi:hypothetical protein